MKNPVRFLSAILLLTSIAPPVAVAQSAGQPVEEVTVFAPYVVKKSVTKAPRSLPVSTINMSRGISYHGLDLTADADVATLETRVRQGAEDICKELDRRYPKTAYIAVQEDKECAKNAAESAMVEVRTVVAAVRAK
jgi:UrcA family protein